MSTETRTEERQTDEGTIDALQINGRGGWTVRETATHYVDVQPMLFNDRICLTPKACTDVYEYGWCYDQGGAAILAALAWDPDTQAEPAGFKKRIAPPGQQRTLSNGEGSAGNG